MRGGVVGEAHSRSPIKKVLNCSVDRGRACGAGAEPCPDSAGVRAARSHACLRYVDPPSFLPGPGLPRAYLRLRAGRQKEASRDSLPLH